MSAPSAAETRKIVRRALAAHWLGYLILGSLLLLGTVVPAGLLFLVVESGRGAFTLARFMVQGGIVLPILSWQILRGLWIRFPEPEGTEVFEEVSPLLWNDVREIADLLEAPCPSRILLTEDFNAAAVQIPSFLGLRRTDILTVGLPLLFSLDRERTRSILAHELGHFAGSDGRQWGGIHRQQAIWRNLHRSPSLSVLTPLVRSFAPWHMERAFALSRVAEFRADRASVRVVPPEIAAQALLDVNWLDAVTDRFREPFESRALRGDPIPQDMYQRWAAHMRQPTGPGLQRILKQAALRSVPTATDTHPPLSHRIRNLGEDPGRLALLETPRPATTALDEYFPAKQETILQEFSNQWQFERAEGWAAQKERGDAMRAGRESIDAGTAKGDPSYLASARLGMTELLDGPRVALDWLLAQPSEIGDTPGMLANQGRLRLALGDSEGAPILERAIALDRREAVLGAPLLAEHHGIHGPKEREEHWLGIHREVSEEISRSRMAAADAPAEQGAIAPHGLPPEALDDLRQLVGSQDRVGGAHLVRIPFEGDSGAFPVHLLVVAFRHSLTTTSSPDVRQAVMDHLLGQILEFPWCRGHWTVVDARKLPCKGPFAGGLGEETRISG